MDTHAPDQCSSTVDGEFVPVSRLRLVERAELAAAHAAQRGAVVDRRDGRYRDAARHAMFDGGVGDRGFAPVFGGPPLVAAGAEERARLGGQPAGVVVVEGIAEDDRALADGRWVLGLRVAGTTAGRSACRGDGEDGPDGGGQCHPATICRSASCVVGVRTGSSPCPPRRRWSGPERSASIAAVMARSNLSTARPAIAVAGAGLALAVGGVAEGLALGGGFGGPWLVAVDATVGVVCVAVGLAAWLGRPDSRTGPALVAMGGLWYLGAFGYARDQRLVDLIGFPLQGWFDVLLVVLLLAVTQGGLRVRAAGVV